MLDAVAGNAHRIEHGDRGADVASARMIRVGTAGWALPTSSALELGGVGSHLERYARVFDGVEINSTFYRLPRRSTLERWRDSTPRGFSFSVKVPGAITHEAALRGVKSELREFLEVVRLLDEKLGALLVQLPPRLEYDGRTVRAFFRQLRAEYDGDVVCEPRHASWFSEAASASLAEHRVARAAADPARCAGAEHPAGFARVVYYRLHGSPRMYYSAYSASYLAALGAELQRRARVRGSRIWCIFDNTALGAALPNALELRSHFEPLQRSTPAVSDR